MTQNNRSDTNKKGIKIEAKTKKKYYQTLIYISTYVLKHYIHNHKYLCNINILIFLFFHTIKGVLYLCINQFQVFLLSFGSFPNTKIFSKHKTSFKRNFEKFEEKNKTKQNKIKQVEDKQTKQRPFVLRVVNIKEEGPN